MALSKPLIVATPKTAERIAGALAFDNSAASRKALAEKARKTGAEWLLFERNEQSGWPIGEINRSLRLGYSSFSGIDLQYMEAQTEACWDDFVSRKGKMDFGNTGKGRGAGVKEKETGKGGRKNSKGENGEENYTAAEAKTEKTANAINTTTQSASGRRNNTGSRGTFSLIFDTEQLGGVKYGVPRILRLLESKGVPATFFVTGVACRTYPELLGALRKGGHEVGIHGACHEYLNGLETGRQAEKISEAISDIGGKAAGANLMGRMDSETPKALVRNGIEYFTFPLKNTRPLLADYSPPMWSAPGLFAMPVFAETYGKPFEAIERQISLTLAKAPMEGAHITALTHPFFDGSLSRIGLLEKTIDLLRQNGLEGVCVKDALPQAPAKPNGPAGKGATPSRLGSEGAGTSPKGRGLNGGPIKFRPYGSSGWKGAIERIYNGHSAKRYCKALEKGLQPEMVYI